MENCLSHDCKQYIYPDRKCDIHRPFSPYKIPQQMSKAAWVITGVSSGLGYALALHVASQGNKVCFQPMAGHTMNTFDVFDQVVGTVRSLAKFPEQLKAAGVVPLVLDLDQPDEDVRKAGETALRMLGTVDVLVNNAGCTIIGPVEEQTYVMSEHLFVPND